MTTIESTFVADATRPSGIRVATITTSPSSTSVSTAGIALVEAQIVGLGAVVDRINAIGLEATYGGVYPVPASWAAAAATVKAADAVVIGLPVYDWGPAGITKVATEILGAALEDKPVAFVVAMGSDRAHLAFVPLAASLVLERGIHWIPNGLQLTSDHLQSEETAERAATLAEAVLRAARRMAMS
jgi:NAD(P)H-dependent FMN reductase